MHIYIYMYKYGRPRLRMIIRRLRIRLLLVIVSMSDASDGLYLHGQLVLLSGLVCEMRDGHCRRYNVQTRFSTFKHTPHHEFRQSYPTPSTVVPIA
jgi:hypothetical protein